MVTRLSNSTYYFLERKPSPWGDYGLLLEHGMGMMDRSKSAFHLRRTGPYIDPITLPVGEVVITEQLRMKLLDAGLAGVRCVPVVKDKIVTMDWENWDRRKRNPTVYPYNGTPENYIECGVHSEDSARRMGPLWALDLPVVAKVVRPKRGDVLPGTVKVDEGSLKELDVAVSREVLWPIISRKALDVLRREAGDRVRYIPCRLI
jgi:hypothetical protein